MERRGFIRAGAAALLFGSLPARSARAHDFYLTRLAYESGDWENAPGMAAPVLQALHASGTMRVDPRERVAALADPRMLAAPFCFLGGARLVQFTAAERRHLDRYVRGGGFLLADGQGALFARSFEAEMAGLFGVQALRPLPASHALYSGFYGLEARPLHAVLFDGRIRVLYSNTGLAREWERGAPDSLRLAVNIIHHALGA